MRKRCFTAALLAAVLGLSGCGLQSPFTQKKTTEEIPETQRQSEESAQAGTEQHLEFDTEDNTPFVETEPENVTEPAAEQGETEMVSEKRTEKSVVLQEGAETASYWEIESEEEYMIVPDTESDTERNSAETEAERYPEPVDSILREVIENREALGEHWAVGCEDLQSGAVYGYQDTDILQSASVVKLFIMGAVYRYMCYPPEGEDVIAFGETYEGELRDTIEKMITVSDNDAANVLIERLGEGDFAKGAERISDFCKENGYVGTSIGRRFLESNPTGDNYTTAADTRKFLSDIYHGKLVNEEASAKMLAFVKGQTRKNKIPAGLPEGFTSGNKTGEMPEGYGLGCIENDVAICFPPEGQGEGYILTVLSNDLGGRNDEAIEAIRQISSLTADWYLQGQAMPETETPQGAE